jgi:hypothetical protein
MRDDTQHIQDLINMSYPIPAGDYNINPDVGVVVPSGIALDLGESRFTAIPVASGSNAMFRAHGAENIGIRGGHIIGDRFGHLNDHGEWGMGFKFDSCYNVVMKGTLITNCWGDGIYLGKDNMNVKLEGVLCRDNRRNGLTVTGCHGLQITNCFFTGTNGTPPQAGIDLEPNPGEDVVDVVISKCVASGNAGHGIQLGPRATDLLHASVQRVVISGCTVTANGLDGILVSHSHSVSIAQGCDIRYNKRNGVTVMKATTVTIQNNDVHGNVGYGVIFDRSTGAYRSNKVTGNSRQYRNYRSTVRTK